jgi:hypothetical protein
MVRLLLLLLGTLTAGGPGQRNAAGHRAGQPGRRGAPGIGYADPEEPSPSAPWPGRTGELPPWHPDTADGAGPASGGAGGSGPRRRRISPRIKWALVAVAVGLIFRRAIASVVLTGLSAALHLVGINAHLPVVGFAWPWQTIAAGTTTNTDLGPWVLQKIEGISRPALGVANFNFLFTHKVSKSIGPWPCWYASTFYAVAHASATVDLNPGPAWWAPGLGHYRLQVLSRPVAAKPGRVAVTMVLPRPQLPQSVHDITVDNIPSKPVDTQHSWTYPGFGCGVVLRPQFPESVLYSEAQRIAFYKSQHMPQVTGRLIKTAEAEATQTIRDNFIQPTVNSLGYALDRLTIRWAAAPGRAGGGTGSG